jgi:hypothetical protein
MVVTAVRRSEAIFAKGEFDLDSEKPTWTVPWQRTKIGADAGTSYRAAVASGRRLRRLEVRAGGVDLPDTRPGRLPVGPRRPRATDYCPIPSLFLDLGRRADRLPL